MQHSSGDAEFADWRHYPAGLRELNVLTTPARVLSKLLRQPSKDLLADPGGEIKVRVFDVETNRNSEVTIFRR